MPHSTDSPTPETGIEVAILGGGIVGLALAIGLHSRGVKCKVYEQSREFRHIGAGLGFSPNAVRCMSLLDPKLLAAQQKVATPSGDPNNPMDWFLWVDGFKQEDDAPLGDKEELLFKLYCGQRGFEGCVRSAFLSELIDLQAEGVLEYGKRLVTIDDVPGQKVQLTFADGTTAQADAAIGADGIKSRVRQIVLGEDHPAAFPTYAHKYAFRGLIKMDDLVGAIGEYRARNRHMYLGPDGHVLTVPVAGGTMVNVVAFRHDAAEWPSSDSLAELKLTAPATKGDAKNEYASWGPSVRGIMSLLIEPLDKWAIFDSADHPAPTYTKGRVCVIGDAAHAQSPHHGSGAGCGIEDATALAHLFDAVIATIQQQSPHSVSKANALTAAFVAYDAVRRPRSEWMAASSRLMGELFQWRNPATLRDHDKCHEETYWRSHQIWDYDEQKMLTDAVDEYQRQLKLVSK